jgi:hypothetical protein
MNDSMEEYDSEIDEEEGGDNRGAKWVNTRKLIEEVKDEDLKKILEYFNSEIDRINSATGIN